MTTRSAAVRAGRSGASRRLPKAVKPKPAQQDTKDAAKTLLGLGGRDLRVPCSQGKMWSYALAARGVPCKVLLS